MARDTFAVAYSYYEVLSIGPDASQEEIHAAYRALVKKVHPDGGGTAGAVVRVVVLHLDAVFAGRHDRRV